MTTKYFTFKKGNDYQDIMYLPFSGRYNLCASMVCNQRHVSDFNSYEEVVNYLTNEGYEPYC